MSKNAYVKLRAVLLGLPLSVVKNLAVVEKLGRPLAYRRGTSDEGVLAHSFEQDIFLTGVPEYDPQDGDIVLDVGAHIGDFSLLVAGKIGKGRVHALEPCRETYKMLRLNIALWGTTNIIPHRVALSQRNGKCQLYHAPNRQDWGNSTVHNYLSGHEIANCIKLESFLKKLEADDVAFAKFNCEGSEFQVILGADASTLRRFKMMLILYHCDLNKDYKQTDLIIHLKNSGFSVNIRNQDQMRGWILATRN